MTYQEMIKLVTYDPETGTLTRINKGKNGKGAIHGSTGKHGYIRFGLEGESYLAHRLAWLLHYKAWPQNQIDHINHDTSDNRMTNLREATHSENNRNRKSANPLGKGVYKRGRAFECQIRHGGKNHYLGTFDTPEEAAAAYKAQAAIHHAEFACTEQAEAGA